MDYPSVFEPDIMILIALQSLISWLIHHSQIAQRFIIFRD